MKLVNPKLLFDAFSQLDPTSMTKEEYKALLLEVYQMGYVQAQTDDDKVLYKGIKSCA